MPAVSSYIDQSRFRPSMLQHAGRFNLSRHENDGASVIFLFFLKRSIGLLSAPLRVPLVEKGRGIHDTQTLEHILHFPPRSTCNICLFSFSFLYPCLRAHDVRASATFTVHYPSTLGIPSNVYERQHLCGSIVIAWGVLFANSFIVLFSYNSRLLFFLAVLFFSTIYRRSPYLDRGS
ncbi:hypothetical protein CI102_12925 [Trichoderma harzianum]|uniref:Uncharacterized protein n=1 Tax=Trichoderma harzianum CBS 226.95 TaxID=983964 RepID=A0A2T4AA45_TRIHA|nr:hypothetical protein M431DRAFT_447798 [Trichoderma harzianum CBS 226.95]PKK41827.1 hypothetical protein CI102_12925 [Trichoderma harzianum]PTB53941.1 hypothetical protein M431DRAFT_447798 [Trichoderma harzianum CBS 226.95]